jgi:hypothetical protein
MRPRTVVGEVQGIIDERIQIDRTTRLRKAGLPEV